MKDTIKFNDATLTFKFMDEYKMFMTVLHVKNVDELTLDAFISPFDEGEKVFETFTSRIVEYTELAEELRRYARNEPDADKKIQLPPRSRTCIRCCSTVPPSAWPVFPCASPCL